ncbi:hypothetical protein WSS15_10370 [Acetobacter pasteurianus]|uniref:Alcohol dehydrogenase small subunit n=3 Tax=Acetobacter pasteurianus TaxID=438 RepID=A0A401WZZ0_ACEPA|nr:YjjA family protein [Acetobacter pasteurianus]CCT59826.1 hypothetical protein APA386B_1755 [Acetobacter pasteurianus 386B]GCD57686.1 hypothetical protein NBRC3277_0261 [Acetobacter pasteurianus NBRC 3277]GCD61156.1 hypothetical protein NBRC3278_0249 [Acetobacter pasteurianus NBRC 3278]GCD67532.1 hypothetical protein NBRC3280_0167 [Acetobacter pasteurianus NBRC 3280]GLH28387.1 hypothetical protein WSS15_10370 [Acetobacter pasteurianus]
MLNKKTFLMLAMAAGVVTAPAVHAQGFGGGLGSIGKSALSGAESGVASQGTSMASSMLPSLSSASTGNLAGILGYCVQNNVLQQSSSTAQSVLGSLTQQPGVTSSSAYEAGQRGLLQTGNNQMFSLANLKGELKTKLCSMVLDKAQSAL